MPNADNTQKLDIPTIDSRSLVDKVESALIELLISEKLNPGDLIPKELELTQMLGVSRSVIREALTRLKTMGIIETTKRKGSIIKSPDLAQLLRKSFIPNILDKGTLRDMFELRLVMEIGMSDLIAQRATPEDIAELEAMVQSEPTASADVHFEVEHEIKFHGKLYEISGNQALMNFQSILLPAFRYVYDAEIVNNLPEDDKWVSHQELVRILKEGSPNQFHKAMRKHLKRHLKVYFGGITKKRGSNT